MLQLETREINVKDVFLTVARPGRRQTELEDLFLGPHQCTVWSMFSSMKYWFSPDLMNRNARMRGKCLKNNKIGDGQHKHTNKTNIVKVIWKFGWRRLDKGFIVEKGYGLLVEIKWWAGREGADISVRLAVHVLALKSDASIQIPAFPFTSM